MTSNVQFSRDGAIAQQRFSRVCTLAYPDGGISDVPALVTLFEDLRRDVLDLDGKDSDSDKQVQGAETPSFHYEPTVKRVLFFLRRSGCLGVGAKIYRQLRKECLQPTG